MNRNPLTIKQQNFCLEYVKAGNACGAYRHAYDAKKMKPGTIARKAQELLVLGHVSAYIEDIRRKTAERVQFSIDDVLSHWVKIATADPNEIIQNRRTCCRHCHGVSFARQWGEIEYAMVCAKAIDQDRKLPKNPPGGFGYNATRDPHPECPFCFGEGVEGVFVADTRRLKGNAKLLYAGIKKSRSGIEIKLRDQDDAMRNIAKFLGMFKDTLEVSGKNGGPVSVTAISAVTTDPIEAAKIYQRIMNGS